MLHSQPFLLTLMNVHCGCEVTHMVVGSSVLRRYMLAWCSRLAPLVCASALGLTCMYYSSTRHSCRAWVLKHTLQYQHRIVFQQGCGLASTIYQPF